MTDQYEKWRPDWFQPVTAVPCGRDKELRILCYETEGSVFAEVRLWRKREEWEQTRNSVRSDIDRLPLLIEALQRALEIGRHHKGEA